ncbi:MAG: nucleotidyltransferase domain-containing protein [Herpetosiphon sp.]|nr:nucleotidyltransferase domain-containing protein [Herpetosiphon sp.]
MQFQMAFPTTIHQRAAETICAFWQQHEQTAAVILTNSCARGVATPESDLDCVILLHDACSANDQTMLEAQWHDFYATEPIFQQLKQCGQFVGVHLDCSKADWQATVWDDGGGPDDFELIIGNLVAYSACIWQVDGAFDQLKVRWLPYYSDELRHARLVMVRQACHYDLDHVPFFVQRKLYFQAFDRLYKAFQEFLQALFIAHKTYPIAYNKWIQQQVAEILNLPELYAQLPRILQISQLESTEINSNAAMLRDLLEQWTYLPSHQPK